jgi:hypothetical protein
MKYMNTLGTVISYVVTWSLALTLVQGYDIVHVTSVLYYLYIRNWTLLNRILVILAEHLFNESVTLEDARNI